MNAVPLSGAQAELKKLKVFLNDGKVTARGRWLQSRPLVGC